MYKRLIIPCRGVLQSAANLLIIVIAGGNHTIIHISRPRAIIDRPYVRRTENLRIKQGLSRCFETAPCFVDFFLLFSGAGDIMKTEILLMNTPQKEDLLWIPFM